ncbi:hypothetical protein [Lactococcus lactis]|uniref:hypothetical protein n=1 Tax=Lactococcus lactis TaxID=1358 RepID=UPI00189A8CF4|nr:hypothetical protein [Lactococcus lactis]
MEKERLDIDSQSNKSIFYERLLILSNLKRESFNRIEINLGYSRNAISLSKLVII